MRIFVEYIAAALIMVVALMAALWALEFVIDNVFSPLLDKLLWGGYEAVMTVLEVVGL